MKSELLGRKVKSTDYAYSLGRVSALEKKQGGSLLLLMKILTKMIWMDFSKKKKIIYSKK
ncbi:MAG: hypothetical protein B5M54_08390 [Candidatus Aminicenantes bacterium 4484_214]|nr:MAG: hypothetical protein B5M54_08390 [Candidatus Aminicenantes bacterium 4484_214]